MKTNTKLAIVAASLGSFAIPATSSAQSNSAFFRLLQGFATSDQNPEFEGAVYAMANGEAANTIVGYGRKDDGTLSLIGSYATGGQGASFDAGEGLDPLISAYAVEATTDQRYLITVNAGSSTVTAFRVNPDRSLTKAGSAFTFGIGPNSLAVRGNSVVVTNIDADGDFTGEPDQEGSMIAFRLTRFGDLVPIFSTYRSLGNRPSAVRFAPDGKSLLISSINAGSAALASGSQDEIVLFGIDRGRLSAQPIAATTSTFRDNAEGRNLPSAIGFEVVEEGGRQYAVVSEGREFQSDGSPPAFPALQTGSVSTWEITGDRDLSPVNIDVLAGTSFTDGERTTCWITFSADQDYFWVANAVEASLSTYSFSDGQISLLEQVAAAGTGPGSTDPDVAFATTDGWIDLDTSDDGRYVYQLFGLAGTIGVFEVEEGGSLTPIQEVTDILPLENIQGLIAF